jgi:DNA-directed RNA polymerase specialized sigma24 family protein
MNVVQQAVRRLDSDLQAMRDTIRKCWTSSHDAFRFVAALGEHNLMLARGTHSTFLVVDHTGAVHPLNPSLLGCSAAEIQSRCSDLAGADLSRLNDTYDRATIRDMLDSISPKQALSLQYTAIALDPLHPDDLLQEAKLRILDCRRKWPVYRSLELQFFYVMLSLSRNAAKQYKRIIPESQLPEAGFSDTSGDSTFLSMIEDDAADPEEQAVARQSLRRVAKACRSDPTAFSILTSKLIGKTAAEIAHELHLNQTNFRAAAQRLRRLADKVLRPK